MSVESWKSIFDVAAVALLFLTFAAGAGVLVTGSVINRRQDTKLKQFETDITGAKTELARQQERAALAETRLAQQIASTGSRNLVILASQEEIAKKLQMFSGQEFEIASNVTEFSQLEIIGTRAAISGTLGMANWKEMPEKTTRAWAHAIMIFSRADASPGTKQAATKLAFQLDETLGKKTIKGLNVGFVGTGEVKSDEATGMVPSGKDVILVFVGSHI